MKKGFTLVELLAVIVILAIILAIAIPGISSIINSAKRSSFESSAKMVLVAVNYKMLEDETFDPSTVNESNVKTLLDLGDDNYQSLTVKEVNDVLHITIVGKNKWENLTVSGTEALANTEDTVTSFVGGANAPALASGMTPIKWNGSAWVNTTETDVTWYNYDTTNKIWANAKTADGSMWVWIPRYIYKISTGWHTSTAGTIDIQFSKGVDDNWNKQVIGDIKLDESSNASNNTWTNHPAFTFGSSELTGIWVSKFEASGAASAINFVPNASSLLWLSIDKMFTSSRNIEINSRYGFGTTGNNIDTHLIKITEWGAVAYLSKSSYGKNAEVWINNSTTYTTGCAGATVSAASFDGCANAYNTTNGMQASTTGNIYGIYDMSGGAGEYTASFLDNGDTSLTTYGNSILNAASKYKDIYMPGIPDQPINNYDLAINKKGGMGYETSSSYTASLSWYGDYSRMASGNHTWLKGGGDCYDTAGGGIFSLTSDNGEDGNTYSFHTVLLLGEGL